MNFGKIDNIILFGGSPLLFETILILGKYKTKLIVASSNNQLTTFNLQFNATLEDFLKDRKIKYFSFKKYDELLNLKEFITPRTFGFSISAVWIFKREMIDLLNNRLINLHGSNLPLLGGGGGISWNILMNCRIGGSTIHFIDEGIDTGEILLQEEYIFPDDCKVPKDYEKYSFKKNKETIQKFFDDLYLEKNFILSGQNRLLSTYWPRLNTDIHGFIDWHLHVDELYRFICAFDEPYKGASSYLGKERIYLKNCFVEKSSLFHPFQFGIVYRKFDRKIHIAANGGSIVIDDIKDEKENNFYNKIKVGERFFTPQNKLNSAKATKAIYK